MQKVRNIRIPREGGGTEEGGRKKVATGKHGSEISY
jgi:hypothetical protein